MAMKKAGAVFLAGILLCGAVSCGKENSTLQIVEKSEPEPQYISFFASENMTKSDLGKYWSEQFVELYKQEVYINYDGATYYADEGLSYRELLEKDRKSVV